MADGSAYDIPAVYHFRVKGRLDAAWSGWFEGLAVAAQEGDETVIAGTVADQAALHGLLARIRDLGLPLLSVRRVEEGEPPTALETGRP